MINIKPETRWVLLGIVAILAIMAMVLMFKMGATGKMYYFNTPDEACAVHTQMCEDGLPPVWTGNIDVGANLVECRCQTNPNRTGWRSMMLTYGRVY